MGNNCHTTRATRVRSPRGGERSAQSHSHGPSASASARLCNCGHFQFETSDSKRHLHSEDSDSDSDSDSGSDSSHFNCHLDCLERGLEVTTLEKVINALRKSGLESSKIILGVDFTLSNDWKGKYSFNGAPLHAIGTTPNPYEQAISIIGRTLSTFDEDKLIPCFGFGDATTHDQYVFSFYPDHRPCNGFEEALARYREIVPLLDLAGPTSFAPVIDAAVDIVGKNNFRYHVLVIIADGQFVNFTDIMSKNMDLDIKEHIFALVALREIPHQFKATLTLKRKEHNAGSKKPLPPPRAVVEHDAASRPPVEPPVEPPVVPPVEPPVVPPARRECCVCFSDETDMAFKCGHMTCTDCGPTLDFCPICRVPITLRIRLYNN